MAAKVITVAVPSCSLFGGRCPTRISRERVPNVDAATTNNVATSDAD